MNEGELLLRQFGPLILFFGLMLLSTILSGSLFDNSGASYPYSLNRTYQYREELVSYRLNQIYYVSTYTMRDFKYDGRLKFELDRKVEKDVLRTLDRQCNQAKQRRQ